MFCFNWFMLQLLQLQLCKSLKWRVNSIGEVVRPVHCQSTIETQSAVFHSLLQRNSAQGMDIEMDILHDSKVSSSKKKHQQFKQPTVHTSLLYPENQSKNNCIKDDGKSTPPVIPMLVIACLVVAMVFCSSFLIYVEDSKGSNSISSAFLLLVGVLNSLVGSLLSAGGYCCQRWAHLKVQEQSELKSAPRHPIYILGLFLLVMGTISAVINLGLLGQTVQAPFAALTLIYNALLAHIVLHEEYGRHDFYASILIVLGVAIAVVGAEQSIVPVHVYTLDSLLDLYWFNSSIPMLHTVFALGFIVILARHVTLHHLEKTAIGLFCFSFSAGLVGGFTSLMVKSTIEIVKAAVDNDSKDWSNPLSYVFAALVPCFLCSQLYFMNKGLQHFGALKFVPLYQSFIILGNMLCGIIYFDELAEYSYLSIVLFFLGSLCTIMGVIALLSKVSQENEAKELHRYVAIHHHDESETLEELNEMTWASGDVRFLTDFDQCTSTIVDLFSSATSTIYYSTFLCDFCQPLPLPNGSRGGGSGSGSTSLCNGSRGGGSGSGSGSGSTSTSILELIEKAVQRGVDVHILYNPIADYGTFDVSKLVDLLPSQVNVHCSVSDLGPNCLTQCLSNNSRYAFHHQKYLCIDGERIMITGCDVNEERSGWLRRNEFGYYWHELGVVTSCTPAMYSWIQSNHDEMHASPPYPLVSGGWKEENIMVKMIRKASYSIQLENQIFISGGVEQENRIAKAIVDRIAEAVKRREKFYVMIFTNAAQKDEPSLLTRFYCTLSLDWSLKSFEVLAEARNITKQQLYQHLVVARLEYQNTLVKVHSNLIIQDGIRCIRTSSNLGDRSLSHLPCDTEMGLMTEGITVTELQQSLLNMYFLTHEKRYTMKEAFEGASHNQGIIRCLRPGRRPYWCLRLLMRLFIGGSQGATGGNYIVHFTTNVAKSGYRDQLKQDNLRLV